MRRIEIVGLAVLVLAAGAAWGIGGQAGDRVAGGRYLTGLGAPWLVVAFAVGALLPRRHAVRTAAVAGAALLVAGVLAYYLVHAVRRGSYDRFTLVGVTVAWSSFAALAGGVFAVAGAAWRRGTAWLGAVPAAALLGEAFALSSEWRVATGPAAAVTLELLAGVVLLAAATWRTRWALPAAVALAAVCGLAETEVREVARSAGWAGL